MVSRTALCGRQVSKARGDFARSISCTLSDRLRFDR